MKPNGCCVNPRPSWFTSRATSSSISPTTRRRLMETVVSPQSAICFLHDLNGAQRLNGLSGLNNVLDFVGRTETERKPFQYRVTLQHVERTQQNPYGLVVRSVEQRDLFRSAITGVLPGPSGHRSNIRSRGKLNLPGRRASHSPIKARA